MQSNSINLPLKGSGPVRGQETLSCSQVMQKPFANEESVRPLLAAIARPGFKMQRAKQKAFLGPFLHVHTYDIYIYTC